MYLKGIEGLVSILSLWGVASVVPVLFGEVTPDLSLYSIIEKLGLVGVLIIVIRYLANQNDTVLVALRNEVATLQIDLTEFKSSTRELTLQLSTAMERLTAIHADLISSNTLQHNNCLVAISSLTASVDTLVKTLANDKRIEKSN